MLKIFDRYIIKQYITTFIFTMLMITLISICINFFENVDKFLSDELTFKQIVFDYYLHFIPWINGLLWPLFALLSVIFFTSRLARNTEVVAILNAGVPYTRFLRPYLITAGILSLTLWYANNYVIPKSTRIKNEFESEYIRKSNKQTLTSDVHFFIGPNEKVYFRMYSQRDSSVRNFRLERFKDNKLVYVLKSDKLTFSGKTNTWQINNFEERSVGDSIERLVILPKAKIDTIFPFHPDDFIRYSKQMEMMTSTDLRKFIAEEQRKGLSTPERFLVELYRRTADPFTIFILTVIGACVASRKVRGGMGLHLAAGVVIGASYVILSKFAVTFVTNVGFTPLLGVWIPNIVFTIVAYYLYSKAQK